MELLKQILKNSKKVDEKFIGLDKKNLERTRLIFNVPIFHPRFKKIKKYPLFFSKIEKLNEIPIYKKSKNKIFLIDKSISNLKFIREFIKNNKIKPIIIKSIENKTKTKDFVDKLVQRKEFKKEDSLIVVLGGGLLINIGAYLAESISSKLILLPSTVLSMADGSGGKVRINIIDKKKAYKHYFKSYYEPNMILLDKRFLDSLPKTQVKIGLVEIIKHGLFQSSSLYNYILKNKNSLFSDKRKLMKIILWAQDLKRICMEVDVEENENGSKRILRGGHDFSDRLEEGQNLTIPHGFAVSIGIIMQLKKDKKSEFLKKANKIFNAFKIPKTLKEFKNLK